MSFIFSQALAAASLPANYVDIDAYAPLNLIPTLKRSSSRGKTMEPFLRSRFGMTFEPLTDTDGEELLMLWLEGFPARTSAQQEPAMVSMAKEVGSGRKWRGSFAKFDPGESKWKTAQCSLLGDSEEFSETWPRWGSMLSGECYLRPIVAPTISESVSGFWPTPTVCGNYNRKGASKSSGDSLATAVKMWPTPTSSLADKGGRVTPNKAREGGTLIEALSARTWPTPCASASKGSSPAALTRKSGKDRSNDRIDHAVMASDGGQLNPEWVEWLMGWPIGHTALEPLATDRYREWISQHSPCSPKQPTTEDTK